MRVRFPVATAACLALLAGCNDWVAYTNLMPASERDQVDLQGDYQFNEVIVNYSPMRDGRYRIVFDPAGQGKESYAGFDQIDGWVQEDTTYRYYIIEVEDVVREPDAPKVHYEISYTAKQGNKPATLTGYTVLCSDATKAIIRQTESGKCVFKSYADVKRAAMDVLDWMSDPRARIETTEQFKAEPVEGS